MGHYPQNSSNQNTINMRTLLVNRISSLLVLFMCACLLLGSSNIQAQSIRKNYREMTTQEQINYVNALNTLYTSSPNVITQFVGYHLAYNGTTGFARHFSDDFLPWHRMYLYALEKRLKSINSKIAIPYWDWTTPGDWSSTSPLFQDGMGGRLGLFGRNLNTNWRASISRSFSSPDLQPTVAQLNTLLTNTVFSTFRSNLEGNPHGMAHCFVGGTMCNINNSPRDPVFYLHHNMVDKLYEDWARLRWNGGVISTFSNPMIYLPNESINPNIIIDSRAIKVWFASNGQVVIDNYTVSNTTLGQTTGNELYRYTGKIIFGSSTTRKFTVPSGLTCTSISSTSISLQPGFEGKAGCTFSGQIDATLFNVRTEEDIAAESLAETAGLVESEALVAYPNPTKSKLNVRIPHYVEMYSYEVMDQMGNSVLANSNQSDLQPIIDLEGFSSGLYMIKFKYSNGENVMIKLIKE